MKVAASIAAIIILAITLWIPAQPTEAGSVSRIDIPFMSIDARLKEFPIVGETWAIDPWEKGIGHLQGTAWFGETGNVVVAAHSVMPDQRAGIFFSLNRIAMGAEIIVTTQAGEFRYVVMEQQVVSEWDVSVVYPTGDNRLTLITCDPASYDAATNTYTHRIVVVAFPA